MFYNYLLPNFIEQLLHITNNVGNIALNGIFLELYYKRNLFYFSLFVFFLCYILNFYYYIPLIFVFLSLNILARSYYKWKQVLEYNFRI